MVDPTAACDEDALPVRQRPWVRDMFAATSGPAAPGPPDGSFFFGFGMLAAMPLSIEVMLAYSGIATSQGYR